MTRRAVVRSAAVLAVLALVAACTSSPPTPAPQTGGSTTASGPSAGASSSGTAGPSSSTGQAPAEDPALNSCDTIAVMPCQRQVADVALPITGSTVTLTYASDRAPGRTADSSPSATGIGLGGWTLSILDTLDAASHVEISGAGLRRHVTGVALPDGSTAVADPTGTRVAVFDATGRETSLRDAVTGAVVATFTWGEHGLQTVADSIGAVLTVIRTAEGTPTGIAVRDGHTISLGLRDGALAGVGYPDGTVAIVHTAAGGLVDQVWDPSGVSTQFNYDAQGRLAARTTGAGATTTYGRTVTDGRLIVTTTLPSGGQVVDTVTHAGGTITRTHTDVSGATTTQVEDGSSRTVTTPNGGTLRATLAPDPRWGADAPVLASFTAPSVGGAGDGPALNQTQTVTATGGSGPASPQALDRTVTIDGATWTIHYDPATRTATVTDPAGITVTTVTDPAGRVVSRSGGGGVGVTYAYDDKGLLTSITLGTGPDARAWRFAYRQNEVSVTDPVGGVQVRTVDAAGRLASITGPGGQSLTLSRDGAGRVTGFAAATGGAYQLTLRADGSLAAVNAPAGQGGPQFAWLSYDAAGALVGESTADTTLTIDRNAAGNPISVDAGAGTYTAAYDATGRLTTWTGPGVSTVEAYTGRYVTAETTSGTVAGRISRTVDRFGRTATETVDGTDPVAYTYDAAGRLTGAGAMSITLDPATGRVASQRIGSVTESFTHNQFGETTRETVTGPGGATIADIAYQRDGLGRVTTVTSTVGGATSVTKYGYDAAGRLAVETTDGKKTSYTYDAGGNLTSITNAAGTVTKLAYDGRSALVSSGGVTYTYDGAGRLKTATGPGGTTTYTYDAAGALRSVAQPGKPEIVYTVDGFGRRVATSVGGTVTQGVIYRDPLRVAAITDGTGNITQRFVYVGTSSLPAYAVIGGTTYAEIPDAAGGPGLVVDTTTGAVADRTVRTALGATVSESHPGLQALGFAAGLADPATGLVRFGARDYDPATGRWTAPDPLLVGGGSANLYQYVGGDPVNRSDHSGMFCDYVSVGVTVGGGVGPGYGSTTIGIATAGGQLGVFNTTGGGVGFGGGVGVTLNCMDNDDPNNSPDLNDFSGRGSSAEVSAAGFTGGVDQGYGADGKPSSHGGHIGFGGDGIGADATYGNTDITCLFGCGPAGGDGPGPGEVCGNLGCAPMGPPDNKPSDPCAGGACDPLGGPQPGGGRGTGDPHFYTMDHTRYDMQAAGEFTALASDSGDLVIQERQQPFGKSTSVAVITALAFSLAGDRLMVELPPGSPPALKVSSTMPLPGAGVAVLPHGARMRITPVTAVLSTPDGTTITVRALTSGLDFTVTLADSRKGHVHGLLGPFTGNSAGTVQTAGGATLTTDQLHDYTTLYRTYADSWRITDASSLFIYPPGKSTASYTDKAFPDPNPAPASAAALAAAKAICTAMGIPAADLPACILDVSVTGETAFAGSLATTLGIVPGATVSNNQVVGQITPGQTVAGTISAGAQKSYTFTAPAGLVGFFVAAPGCTTQDVWWAIEATDGTSLTGPNGICNDIGRVQFPATGDYRLRVYTGGGGSGPYSVVWMPSRPDRAGTLAAGQTVSGSIDKPGALDYYVIHATANQVAYFAAAADCTAKDLWWSVDARSGDRWSPFVGADGMCGDLGRVVFTQTGDYRIVVRGGGGASRVTGPYTFTWVTSRPDVVSAASAGQTLTGTIDKAGAQDVFTMDVVAGTVAYLQADTACTAKDLRWLVQYPDSRTAMTGSESVCDDLGRVRFDDAGAYRLVLYGDGLATGSFRVTWVASRPDLVQALPASGTVSGSIDKPGARDAFTIAPAGSITLRAAPGCVAPTDGQPGLVYWVQQVGGGPVSGQALICTDLGTVALPSPGTYQVVVGGQQAATGAYSFVRTG